MNNQSTKPKRVLHLIRTLRVGGLERVVIDLVDGLQVHGYGCYLGCLTGEGEWSGRVEVDGHWLGDIEGCGKWKTIFSLARYLRANRIDLLHSHNSQAHLIGAVAALLARVPLVHTKHGQNWPDDPKWLWKSRQASRLSRKIVAVSDDIARIVTELERVPVAKVATVHNGVDVTALVGGISDEERNRSRKQAREALGLDGESFVVGTVGRLAWEKNYELLVDAFARFHATCPEARMVIVGEGPYRPRIEKKISTHELGSACLLAGQRDDVPLWLSAFDVFCLSSLTEGTSITLLEAGASGLPAVVTDVGGNAEVVQDGQTGVVVPSEDEASLAGALVAIHADPVWMRKMGIAARARIANEYSVESTTANYIRIYDEALGL